MEGNRPFMPPPPKELRNLPPLPPKQKKEEVKETVNEQPEVNLDDRSVDKKIEVDLSVGNDKSKVDFCLIFNWVGFIVSLALTAVFIFLLVK